MENILLTAKEETLDLQPLVRGVGSGFSDHPNLDALGKVAVPQTRSFITPGLTDLDGPQLTLDVDLENAVRIAQPDSFYDTDELDVFTGRPGPAVMCERHTTLNDQAK